MDVRAVTFLSSFLLVIKCNLCQTVSANSVSLSGSVGQSYPNQFTVPAVIKPHVTFDSSNLVQAYNQNQYIPNYNDLTYQQPPLPIIIDNVPSSGSNSNLMSLLFLLFALNNNKKGGGCNGGGCNGGGCNCGGCNGGGCNCGGCNYGGYNNGYYGGSDYYDNYGPGPIPVDLYNNVPVAEITINSGGYIDETIVSEPYYPPYPSIQATPGRVPNELTLTITSNYATNC